MLLWMLWDLSIRTEPLIMMDTSQTLCCISKLLSWGYSWYVVCYSMLLKLGLEALHCYQMTISYLQIWCFQKLSSAGCIQMLRVKRYIKSSSDSLHIFFIVLGTFFFNFRCIIFVIICFFCFFHIHQTTWDEYRIWEYVALALSWPGTK